MRVFVRLLMVVALATAMLYATIGTTASQTGTGTVDFVATLTLATAKGPVGSEHVVATFDVPAEFQGQTCPTRFAPQNNESEHPGNDLILESAGGQIVLEDVEAIAGEVTQGSGNITLGPQLIVTMVLGSDANPAAGSQSVPSLAWPLVSTRPATHSRPAVLSASPRVSTRPATHSRSAVLSATPRVSTRTATHSRSAALSVSPCCASPAEVRLRSVQYSTSSTSCPVGSRK